MQTGYLFANRFTIERSAGAGGMGAIFKARDEYSGQPVAVKLIHLSNREDLNERFAREAFVLAELQHPGIVSYIAHGTAPDGQPFLAMEWLEGENLYACLRRRGPLSLAEAMTFFHSIARPLAAAHEKGIVHRDQSKIYRTCPRSCLRTPQRRRQHHARSHHQ